MGIEVLKVKIFKDAGKDFVIRSFLFNVNVIIKKFMNDFMLPDTTKKTKKET